MGQRSVDTKPVTAIQAPKVDSNECAVQVRMPDGTTKQQDFKADDKISDVRNWLGLSRNQVLGTTFPRTEFNNHSATLRSLGLGPRCAFVIFKK